MQASSALIARCPGATGGSEESSKGVVLISELLYAACQRETIKMQSDKKNPENSQL